MADLDDYRNENTSLPTPGLEPRTLQPVTCRWNKNCIASFIFFLHGAAAQRGLWPPHSRGFRDHTLDAPQSVGLLWTSDQSVAETST
jgi:hypothetical protein